MCRAVLFKEGRTIQHSHLGQVLTALWVRTLISYPAWNAVTLKLRHVKGTDWACSHLAEALCPPLCLPAISSKIIRFPATETSSTLWWQEPFRFHVNNLTDNLPKPRRHHPGKDTAWAIIIDQDERIMDLVSGIPAWGVGTRRSLRSFPIQAILGPSSQIFFTTEALVPLPSENWVLLTQLLLWVQLLVLLPSAAQCKRRIQRRRSQPNPLTLPDCSVHLRGVQELLAFVSVGDLPLPCLAFRQPLEFKFQGTPSDDTCSSSKGRGWAWDTALKCVLHTGVPNVSHKNVEMLQETLPEGTCPPPSSEQDCHQC